MPAVYTHDRFGQDVIGQIAGSAKELIVTERRAFDIGLQGPDILFYFRPYLPNSLPGLGRKLHHYSGRRYYGNLARIQAEEGDDASFAYLLGSVCHYTLDSLCHPVIDARAAEGDVLHEDIEAALDLAMVTADGLDPGTTVLGENLEGDDVPDIAQSVSCFYPGIPVKRLTESILSIPRLQRLLVVPTARRRKMMGAAMTILGKKGVSLRAHILPERQPEELGDTLAAIADAYDRALAEAPSNLAAVVEAVYRGRTLPARFRMDFGGKTV